MRESVGDRIQLSMASASGIEESKTPTEQKALEDRLSAALRGVEDPEQLIDDRSWYEQEL